MYSFWWLGGFNGNETNKLGKFAEITSDIMGELVNIRTESFLKYLHRKKEMNLDFFRLFPEAYLGLWQTSAMELFPKIENNLLLLTI